MLYRRILVLQGFFIVLYQCQDLGMCSFVHLYTEINEDKKGNASDILVDTATHGKRIIDAV